MERHRNPDGTINGITFLAEVTGLSAAEVRWTWDRLSHLMKAEQKTKAEALAIVREESQGKPWEKK